MCIKDLSVSDLLQQLTAMEKKRIYVALDRLSRQKNVDDLAQSLMPLLNLLN